MSYPGTYKLKGQLHLVVLIHHKERKVRDILVLELAIVLSFIRNTISPNEVNLP